MADALNFHFDVDGDDFKSAGHASFLMKKNLRQLGIPPEIIRKVSIAMYEGEINMVIHAGGGTADITVSESDVEIVLKDSGPGIKNIDEVWTKPLEDTLHTSIFGVGTVKISDLIGKTMKHIKI